MSVSCGQAGEAAQPVEEDRACSFPFSALAGMFAFTALHDYLSYNIPYNWAVAITLLHACALVALAIVNLKHALSFFVVSLVCSDEISRRLGSTAGELDVVNIATFSIGGLALINILALILFGFTALFTALAWSRNPRPIHFGLADRSVGMIALVYALAALHGAGNMTADFRLWLNHINLPLMACGFYFVVRACVSNRADFFRLWRWLMLALGAKTLWWTTLVLVGIASQFGTTLRAGFGAIWTLFVLLLLYGLLVQQRRLTLPKRDRLLLLICAVLAAGQLLISAGRMLWLLTALSAFIVLAVSEIGSKIRFLVLGALASVLIFLAIVGLRPQTFETISYMASTLKLWDRNSMANSHSSMVRVYEFKNIHAQLEDHGNLILGDGPGSRFTDRYHPFPFGLTENDYSLEERMSRRFRKSHSLIAQLMLQLGYAGMLWYLLCVAGLCLACWRVYRVTADPALKTVALSLLAFLPALVYMSWNSKANMLLGLLLGMVGAAHHWEVGRDSLLPGLRETPAPK